jgi:hypothetical protein
VFAAHQILMHLLDQGGISEVGKHDIVGGDGGSTWRKMARKRPPS